MLSLYGDVENARTENARMENVEPNCRGGKHENRKRKKYKGKIMLYLSNFHWEGQSHCGGQSFD